MSAYPLDEAHAAYVVGYDHGYAKGQLAASEDLARQWLADLSRGFTASAVSLAAQRHGPAWAESIRQQAEEVA